jgi:uncharacterized membrane protein
MRNLITTAKTFYCIGIAGIGVQQFYYNEFRPVLIPSWPSWLPGVIVWSYLTGALLILLSIFMLINKNAKSSALLLGGFFLFLFLFFHVTYLLFVYPYTWHLGVWTDAFKASALSGGAFVVAGSFPLADSNAGNNSFITKFFSKLIPYGKIFFSTTLIVFGIDHFLYTETVAALVPDWISGHIFWTYFAGVALIGSGVAIILNIQRRLISLLTGIMIFIWFLILHIPRAFAHPEIAKGNEVTSVFEALAFSGIAFLISLTDSKKDERK